MAKLSNRFVVAVALGANLAIAAAKFVAAAITGSAAMAAEGIHSLVDTGDGGLLLLGEHLGKRPADELHPFGHGREVFFWSFLVAVIIFGVGGCVSIYRGISHLVHPEPPGNPTWNYAVLGVAFVLESISWCFSVQGFYGRKPREKSAWQYLHTSKDPAILTVLVEDTTDLLGLLIAFGGVLTGQWTGSVYADGAASVLIGCMLAAVALLLVYETRGLLLGEAADPASVRGMRAVAQADPAVEKVEYPATVYLSPHDILLALGIEFHKGLTMEELTSAIERVQEAIRAKYPDVRRIFVEAKAISDELKPARQASGGREVP